MCLRTTIVIKVGSASLVDERTFQPKFWAFQSVAETVTQLRTAGHDVVVVSSGAVAIGRGVCGIGKRSLPPSRKRALAAIGQNELMSLWNAAFLEYRQRTAQVLLTRDVDNAKWQQQTKSMIKSLLSFGVVPILNENDAVIAAPFGGNDILALIVAKNIGASTLTFLTDVDCLYNKNPRTNPDAEAIELVRDWTRLNIDVRSSGTSLGTGGMDSKFHSAKVASSFGISTIINNISTAQNIVNIIHNLTSCENNHYETSPEISDDESTVVDSMQLRWSRNRRLTSLHTLFLATGAPSRTSENVWEMLDKAV